LRILAVDTSGKEVGIGVFDGKKCLYESYITADRAYNRHIMPMIAGAIAKAGVKLEEFDVFAAALGPGSFTGIRVGMAVMKAFAHGLNKKFAGASTLDIMAESAGGRGRVWAVMEAGRNELFAGEYGKSGLPAEASAKAGVQSRRKKQKYLLLARKKFVKKLKTGDTVAGIKGENIMVELKEKNSKIHVIEMEHIDVKSFAAIIERERNTGTKGIYGIAPVYIRASEAEARRRIMKKNGGKSK
jgi:tRNA threonylcarbamoyladenosine biosynthesis protein TsaB